jgi:type IV/VI secretion system ImpK/VasF family protein
MQKESLIKTSTKGERVQLPTNDPISPARAKEPLPTLQTYCKSKTFIANSGINPLVAAASALFSLIHKLRKLKQAPPLENTQAALIHEIKAFECAAQTRGYRADEILVARYILCTTLDEIIHTTEWGKLHNWQNQYSLLQTFQGESWGGERFFLILEKLRDNTQLHRDLLEFAYLCLSLGFQGRYRHLTHGRDDLDQVMDELFHDIRREREETYTKLNNPIKLFKKLPRLMSKPIPVWLIAAFTMALLATVYLGFNYVLKINALPVYKDLSTIMNHHDQH